MLLLSTMIFAAAAGAQPLGDMPVVNPKSSQRTDCPATSRYEASKRGKAPKAEKLGELPNADVYLTVYRRVGGCEVPIIVRYGVGGN